MRLRLARWRACSHSDSKRQSQIGLWNLDTSLMPWSPPELCFQSHLGLFKTLMSTDSASWGAGPWASVSWRFCKWSRCSVRQAGQWLNSVTCPAPFLAGLLSRGTVWSSPSSRPHASEGDACGHSQSWARHARTGATVLSSSAPAAVTMPQTSGL